MSNLNKDHPSIRVYAPPGGRSTNIFGMPEPEMPAITKKNHMESDIFGCKKSETNSSPVKPTRTLTNNIFGSDREQPVQKSSIYSDKNKSTIFDEAPPIQPSTKPDRQRSTIFANEPVQTVHSNRPISDKFKSNIFGHENDDNQKRQGGTRQGLRGRSQSNQYDYYRPSIAISIYSPLRLKDPNASRMGYNPINGEAYGSKDDVTTKMEQVAIVDEVKSVEQDNSEQVKSEDNCEQIENGSNDTTENGHSQATVDKPTNGHTNGNSTTKNGHANVRVFHPPGGRSNGPLW